MLGEEFTTPDSDIQANMTICGGYKANLKFAVTTKIEIEIPVKVFLEIWKSRIEKISGAILALTSLA